MKELQAALAKAQRKGAKLQAQATRSQEEEAILLDYQRQIEGLKKELEDILNLFEELNDADTSEVKAMSHPLNLSQPIRKDEVTEENLRDELLKNAPSVKSGLFLVPKVIDGEN